MRRFAPVLALILAVVLVAPAIAQTTVSASSPSFSWSGKTGDQANYTWSSTVTNPSRREVMVEVTLQLIDASGDVVASDARPATIAAGMEMAVGGDASLAFTDARRAAQYRIVVMGVEDDS